MGLGLPGQRAPHACCAAGGTPARPKSRDPDAHPLDLPGAALSVLGIGALVFAIIEAPEQGWASTETAVAFGVAAVLLVAFLGRELTARVPMLDLRLFRDRRFSVASGGIALSFFTLFGTFFMLTQYLQLVQGYSALRAGILFVPISFTMMIVAPQAPKLVARFGVTNVVPAGLGLVAVGLVALATVDAGSPLWRVYLALLPMMAGMASTMAPLTTSIMSAVPPGRAGVGSAMNDTTRELGGALGRGGARVTAVDRVRGLARHGAGRTAARRSRDSEHGSRRRARGRPIAPG